MKKILAILLAMVMVLSLLPVTALADTTIVTYEKVTTEPSDWSGTYLILYEDGSGNACVWNGVDANDTYTAATYADGKIAASDELAACEVTIAAMDGGYSVQIGDKGYMYGTSGSNKTNFNTSTPQLNTIAMTADGDVQITSNTSVFRFNNAASNGMRFRYYKSTSYSSQQPVYLYERVETVVTCNHEGTTTSVQGKKDATCAEEGYTGDTVCECGYKIATGETIAALGHSWGEWSVVSNATCTEAGSQEHTCATCGNTESEAIAALGHSYGEDGVCTACGAKKTDVVSYELVTLDSIAAGNYVIGAVRAEAYPNVYLATSKIASGYLYVSDNYVTASSDAVSSDLFPSDVQVFVLSGDNTNGFTIGYEVNGAMVYLGYTDISTNHKLAFSADYSNIKWTVAAVENGGFALHSTDGTNNYAISQNSTAASAIRGYNAATKVYTGLYLFAAPGEGGSDEPACQHPNATTVTVDATCTVAGSKTTTCPDCGNEETTVIDALGHNIVDGTCTICGFEGEIDEPDPSVPYVTSPEVGVAYYLVVAQNNSSVNKTLYATGAMSGNYYATTEAEAEAAKVYLESVDGVEGAFRLYFMNGQTKTYLCLYQSPSSNTSGWLKLVTDTPSEYYTFNSTYNTLIHTGANNTFYMGCYSNFTTISGSRITYLSESNVDVSQFPARLYPASEEVAVTAQNGADKLESDIKVTYNGIELPATVTVSDTTMNVAWAIETSDSNAAKIENGVLVIAPQAAAATYTLTATVTNGESDTATATWTGNVVPASTVDFEEGEFVIWVDGKAITTLESGYGYLAAADVALTDNVLTGYADANVFILSANGDGTYAIEDYNGNYLYSDMSYASSTQFNVGEAPVSGKTWTVVAADNGYYIYNVDRAGAIGFNATYGNFGLYKGEEDKSVLTLTEIAACDHSEEKCTTTTVEATCSTNGSVTVTCECGYTVSVEVVKATGHTFTDNACACGATVAEYYIAAIRTAEGSNYMYMTSNLGTASTSRYTAVDSSLTELPAVITDPADGYVFQVIKNADGTYSIAVDGNNYLGHTSTKNNGLLVEIGDAVVLTMTENEDGTFQFSFDDNGTERYLSLNNTTGNDYFAFYKATQVYNINLIPVVRACHEDATTEIVEATCTEDGSITVTCSCGEVIYSEVLSATGHSAEYVAAVEAANCQQTGHDEYWYCASCDCYFGSEDLSYQLNPAWIFSTGDCVRPDDAPACAVVPCELCGEDVYGTEPCVPDGPKCKDGTCTVCGQPTIGWGCTYNTGDEEVPTPLCEPGTCIYCQTEYPNGIYPHENGAWAPCQEGECTYGCGKTYPATAQHTLENPCEAGTCTVCWNYTEAVHAFENGVCTLCGAADPNYVPAVNIDENLKFAQISLAFADYIGVQPIMLLNAVKNYDSYYVELVFSEYGVDPATIIMQPLAESTSSYNVYELPVLPRSMSATIELTIHAEKDGVKYQGNTVVTSIETLALEKIAQFSAQGQTARCRILVDMLNYGAAVQKRFTDNTAYPNLNLGEYAALGTAGTPSITSTVTKSGTSSVRVLKDTLGLGSKVEVQFIFQASAINENHELRYVLDGETYKVAASDFDTETMEGYAVAIFALKPRHFRNEMTIALYDKTTNQPVTQVYTASVAAYALKQVGTANEEAAMAMMNYGDAVIAYFAS